MSQHHWIRVLEGKTLWGVYIISTKEITSLIFNFYKSRGFSELSPVVFFFPTIARWFPRLIGYHKVIDAIHDLAQFVKESFLEHKATFVPGQPRDLIDTMCEEVVATTDPESSFYGSEGGSALTTIQLLHED